MQACLCVGVCGCGKHFEIWIQMNFCVTNEKTKNSIDYMDYFLVEHKKKTTNHLNMMVFFSFCLLACFIPQRSNWMKKRMKSICYRKQKTKIYWFIIIIIVIHHTFYSSYIYILMMMMISAVMKKNFVAWRQSMFKSSSSSSIYIDIDIIRKKHPPNFVHVSNTHIAHIDINFQPL